MVTGKKKWILFDINTKLAIKITQYFYNRQPYYSSWTDWYNKEYAKLKKEDIPLIEFIQESNDIVYVPRNYNHTVCNLTYTLGIIIEVE